MDVTLSTRTQEILHSIVESYIESGEPVASRAVARRRRDNLSAATVRNIMADLADLGYLSQPHTSAGRVPTEKAFRHFAAAAVNGRVHAGEVERFRDHLNQAGSVESRAERSSHLLTELTSNVGIVAAIPASSQALDQIELLLLPDRRVLMVVVTADKVVRHELVTLDEPVTSDDLVSIRNYVNHNFSGWTLSDIHRELHRRLDEEAAAYDRTLRKLTLLYQKGLLRIRLSPQLFMDGASNLVGLDLHLTRERLRELMRALEEKKRILEMLDQFLASGSGGVQVQVGLAEVHPAMSEFSLIGFSVALPGGLSAKLAVLGPMRMNYPRAISAVSHLGRALGSLPQ